MDAEPGSVQPAVGRPPQRVGTRPDATADHQLRHGCRPGRSRRRHRPRRRPLGCVRFHRQLPDRGTRLDRIGEGPRNNSAAPRRVSTVIFASTGFAMATELQPIADIDVFVATRDSLHRVAEHVLAKARFVHDREIRLTTTDGGFGTPLLPDNTRVRVDGSDLVVDTAGRSARIGLTTISDAAAFVGITPGFPVELYPAATPFEPNQPLDVDGDAARALAAWYGFSADVLGQFAVEVREASPSPLILW